MVMIDPRVVLIVVSVLIIYVYCIYLLKLAEWKYDLIHLKTFPTALITASKCAFCDKSVQRTAPLLYIMMKQQIIKRSSPITDYHVHIFVAHDQQWRNEWKKDIIVYYQPSPEKKLWIRSYYLSSPLQKFPNNISAALSSFAQTTSLLYHPTSDSMKDFAFFLQVDFFSRAFWWSSHALHLVLFIWGCIKGW